MCARTRSPVGAQVGVHAPGPRVLARIPAPRPRGHRWRALGAGASACGAYLGQGARVGTTYPLPGSCACNIHAVGAWRAPTMLGLSNWCATIPRLGMPVVCCGQRRDSGLAISQHWPQCREPQCQWPDFSGLSARAGILGRPHSHHWKMDHIQNMSCGILHCEITEARYLGH